MSTSIRPGDSVFVRTGEPMTVKERDQASGVTTLEKDPQVNKENTRHGYINGLSPENRKVFDEILDEVKKGTQDPQERVQKLAEHLQEIENDPRQLVLAKYLRSEMVHIMNSHGLRPKEFTVHDSRVR